MQKEQKYHLFSGATYYPSGGVGDLKLSFTSLSDCWEYLAESYHDWYQIVDAETMITYKSSY